LEAAQVHDEVGRLQVGDLARGELDVVRLGTRRGERLDVHAVAADGLGDHLERIERGEHLEPAVVGGLRALGAPGQREGERDGRDREGREPLPTAPSVCGRTVAAPVGGRARRVHDDDSQSR